MHLIAMAAFQSHCAVPYHDHQEVVAKATHCQGIGLFIGLESITVMEYMMVCACVMVASVVSRQGRVKGIYGGVHVDIVS